MAFVKGYLEIVPEPGVPGQPPGIWGGAPIPTPTPPIYYPPGIWPPPGVPSHPIAGPPPGIWPGPGVPTHPIVIPPDAIGPGVPTHPIYLPLPPSPSHPIVIPPDAIGPGVPSHPIVLPPPVGPSHPIVIPPDAVGPGVPSHPIVIPPPPPLGIWGGSSPWPGYATPPIAPGGERQKLIEWTVGWSAETGWVVVGVPQVPVPSPSAAPATKK